MDLMEAIRSRRTIRLMQSEPVPDGTLETILEAGVWAPNHKLTQPWRFIVLGPQSKLAIAYAILDYRLASMDMATTRLEIDQVIEKIWQRFVRVGAVVAVTCQREPGSSEHQRRDDFAAVCTAIQNMQLAAWSYGIGACWVNGLVTRMSETSKILGTDDRTEELIGIVSLGYPAEPPAKGSRIDARSLTRSLP
jgi:nitroreductase